MSNIKLIVFDLDGVLVDSRELHYLALNMALANIDNKYVISRDEHLTIYDGNTTNTKLRLLTKYKGLPEKYYDIIWKLKQDKTNELIDVYITDDRIIKILQTLSKKYLIYCASNSIHNTVNSILTKKGFIKYFNYILSNEQVIHPKPSPEIYLKCLINANIGPSQCLVLEDSHIGRKAASSAGCHLCEIIDTNDVTINKIYDSIRTAEYKNLMNEFKIKWKHNINVVIPMAGLGTRFKNAGYKNPKPLINVMGKPMIQQVIENLNIDGKYIFIVKSIHLKEHNLEYILKLLVPNCCIIVDDDNLGATSAVLKATHLIDNNTPLLISNSDQILEWDSNNFLYCMTNDNIDGGISTFINNDVNDTKWSYAKLNKNGYVSEVKEKEVISNIATTGIYYWKYGSDFVKYANQMINKNIKVNNEFYICPVYNEAILDNKKIKIKDCNKMWGLGVPDDLNLYLKSICPTKEEYDFFVNKSLS